MRSRRLNMLGLLAVGVVFLVSLSVRFPELHYPVGIDRCQGGNAHMLITLRIWSREGALGEHRLLPIATWPGNANRYIPDAIGRLPGDDGRYYYTTYPMLGFLVPYAAIRPFDSEFSAFSLRVFSLAVGLLCGVLIYLIVVQQTHGPPVARMLGGMLAATTYLLLPISMWYHCHSYFVERLAQPFLLAAIYFAVRTFRKPDVKSVWPHLLLATAFALVLTEWIGVLFSGALWLYVLPAYRGAWRRYLLIGLPAVCAAGLLLTLLHFSLISSPSEVLTTLVEKYRQRSGVAESERFVLWNDHKLWSLESWNVLAGQYWTAFRLCVICAALAMAVWITSGIRRAQQCVQPRFSGWMLPTYLSIVPIVLHHLLMFQFTVHHEFALLKSCIPIALLVGFLGSYAAEVLLRDRADRLRTLKVTGWFVLFMILVGYGHVASYASRQNARPDARAVDFGHAIRQQAEEDEMVFVDCVHIHPQMLLYSERNLKRYEGGKNAAELLEQSGVHRGVLFRARDREFEIERVQHFELDSSGGNQASIRWDFEETVPRN